MSEDNEYLLKICIIGENTEHNRKFGRYWDNRKFDEIGNNILLRTEGIDIATKKITVSKVHIKLILAIRAAQEFFGKLRPSYYRGASGCLILFDKGTVETFTQVTRWLAEFRKHILESTIPIALVGVKTEDQEELITPEEGQQLAEKLQLGYYETQLADKQQVEHIIQKVACLSLVVTWKKVSRGFTEGLRPLVMQ